MAKAVYPPPSERTCRIRVDAVRITDRFFDPGLRGFDIRGIGPRIIRIPYGTDGSLDEKNQTTTDALGGRAYYMGRLELEFPRQFRAEEPRPSAVGIYRRRIAVACEGALAY